MFEVIIESLYWQYILKYRYEERCPGASECFECCLMSSSPVYLRVDRGRMWGCSVYAYHIPGFSTVKNLCFRIIFKMTEMLGRQQSCAAAGAGREGLQVCSLRRASHSWHRPGKWVFRAQTLLWITCSRKEDLAFKKIMPFGNRCLWMPPAL